MEPVKRPSIGEKTVIKKFKTKLRMSSLEDRLHQQFDLRPGMAAWLTRVACDIAGQENINLMAYRGDNLLMQFIWVLDSSAYRSLLGMAAQSSPRFDDYLRAAQADNVNSAVRKAA